MAWNDAVECAARKAARRAMSGGDDPLRTGLGVPNNAVGGNGDNYVRTSNGDFYEKQGGIWVLIGNILGPQGPAGSTGAAGSAGSPGTPGAAGAVGPQGPQGPAGPQGAQGPQGPQGAQGNQGTAGADAAQPIFRRVGLGYAQQISATLAAPAELTPLRINAAKLAVDTWYEFSAFMDFTNNNGNTSGAFIYPVYDGTGSLSLILVDYEDTAGVFKRTKLGSWAAQGPFAKFAGTPSYALMKGTFYSGSVVGDLKMMCARQGATGDVTVAAYSSVTIRKMPSPPTQGTTEAFVAGVK